jgi:8-oxo-dGTP diphosphatase
VGWMRVKQVFEYYQRQGRPEGEFTLCPFCGARLLETESGGRPRAACPSCGFVQHRNPAPVVSILVVDEGRVLLGKRAGEPGRGTWSLPSGYVEYEDDFVSTAIRETKEETGLDVKVVSITNVVSSFVSPRFHFLTVYVVARVVGGELVAADDLAAVAWFPLHGPLPAMGFEEDVKAIELHREGFEGIPVDDEDHEHPCRLAS